MHEFSVGTRVEMIHPEDHSNLGAKGTVNRVFTSLPAVQVAWDNTGSIIGSFCFLERLRIIDEESDVESIW